MCVDFKTESNSPTETLSNRYFRNAVAEGIADAQANNLIPLAVVKRKWAHRVAQRLVIGASAFQFRGQCKAPAQVGDGKPVGQSRPTDDEHEAKNL